MVTAFSLVYSASAVRRIFGISKSVEVHLKNFSKVVWVWVRGKRPTFISKSVFKQHFADWRREQGKALEAVQGVRYPHQFTVRSSDGKKLYFLECRESGVFCTCEDFNNQLQFFGRGCCKHGYAVLNQLGLGSLAQYQQVWAERGSGRRVAA